MVDVLGRSCLKLRNIHIASIRLSHSVVLALTSANLRGLRMLSLVLGSEITDASVAAITSSYTNLELLDLSGSSISDSGIGMICNVFPHTLSRLLLALCPNVTSSGIQFAAAQLPHLRLFDCGMTICDPSVENPSVVENGLPADNSSQELKHQQKVSNTKLYPMYQKLIIKHGRLKKLSLWGCSGLDVYNESAEEDYLPSKRLADGSKRVHVPRFIIRQPSDGDKERALRPRCIVHVD
ncbi:hypothetical protein MRB53_020410 [Persea americana]|uniref:Uncharacterized protein n=1 Tax=Persea americana TaxID=3435 RepID=A0ACC2L262_PERAE|nr:hypothetical protein MRB53_020410 [Persea americana]